MGIELLGDLAACNESRQADWALTPRSLSRAEQRGFRWSQQKKISIRAADLAIIAAPGEERTQMEPNRV